MKILSAILWSMFYVPIGILILKLTGILNITWFLTLFLAIGYVIFIVFSLLILAIWIIKQIPKGDWMDSK